MTLEIIYWNKGLCRVGFDFKKEPYIIMYLHKNWLKWTP